MQCRNFGILCYYVNSFNSSGRDFKRWSNSVQKRGLKEAEHQSRLWYYCGWKKSCTSLEGWNPINSGMFTTCQLGAGFLHVSSIHRITWVEINDGKKTDVISDSQNYHGRIWIDLIVNIHWCPRVWRLPTMLLSHTCCLSHSHLQILGFIPW